jgi:hypothetical protein
MYSLRVAIVLVTLTSLVTGLDERVEHPAQSHKHHKRNSRARRREHYPFESLNLVDSPSEPK